jgi:ribosomal protein S18 acetylase RimI-like enzyme
VESGVVVGSVLAGFDGFRGWLNRIVVFQSYRRRGLCTGLIEEAEKRPKSLGYTKINLQIVGSNGATAGFYRRLGYSVEDWLSVGKLAYQCCDRLWVIKRRRLAQYHAGDDELGP